MEEVRDVPTMRLVEKRARAEEERSWLVKDTHRW